MTLYDYIWDFLYTYIFGSAELVEDLKISYFLGYEDYSVGGALCTLTTIVIMVLFVILLIRLIMWCFKLGRHLLHL